METKNEHYAGMARKSVQVRRLNALERRIQELVNSAPPLTEEQRRRLADILRGAAA